MNKKIERPVESAQNSAPSPAVPAPAMPLAQDHDHRHARPGTPGRRALYHALIIVLPLLAFIGLLASLIDDSRQRTGHDADAVLLASAWLVAEHATGIVQRTDLVLQSIIDHLPPRDIASSHEPQDGHNLQIEALLRQTQRRAAGISALTVTDAHGHVVAGFPTSQPGRHLGDRAYFRQLQDRRDGKPVLSEALPDPVSNQWGVEVARRIEGPDGRLAGVIVANLGLAENFAAFYATLPRGETGFIALRSRDHRVLANFPFDVGALGKVAADSATRVAVAAGASGGARLEPGSGDEGDRRVAVREVPGLSLYAVAGRDTHEVFASWNRLLALAAYAFAGLLVGALALYRAHAANGRIAADLRQVRAALSRANDDDSGPTLARPSPDGADALTGRATRPNFERRLEETIARSHRSQHHFSLLLFDLDHFATINDVFGHPVGDQVLVDLAQLIANRIRINDCVARWGGEEFIVLADGTGIAEASTLAEQLRLAVASQPFPPVGNLTVSIGIAEYRSPEDAGELIARLELALAIAKENGRNRVEWSRPEPDRETR